MTIITSIKVNACRAVAKSEGILSKGVTFEACKGSGQFKPSGKPKNVAEASSLRTAAGSRCHFVPPHGEKVTPNVRNLALC